MRIELWAGPECTFNRVGDRFKDQLPASGFAHRIEDLDRLASLGITRMRFPLVWERTEPRRGEYHWQWSDERIARLRELGVQAIAGLVHHGSGPAWTHLLDPAFPELLAQYAGAVAGRYPHIECWTPVNEPLTTARFSALYGHWYPHRSDGPAFLRALVNQCKGIAAAMAAIRSVSPGAELIQTEDMGKIFSTRALNYQAEHENERRWLSLDLLAGRVTPRHPLYAFLIEAGIGEDEIASLRDGAATPDMIGINHYLTSDRFLDDRTFLYPELEAGGNGRDVYVDAEAVRVPSLQAEVGPAARLKEVWRRYGIPIAVTEVHHGCTRDEQLRWFIHVWNTARALRRQDVDVRAVTLWSVFGNVDWRSLLTREDGVYDTGAFDTRGPTPRPTAVAKAAAAVAGEGSFEHPVLASPGWWRRPSRFYPWCGADAEEPLEGRPLLITGATGTLGRALARVAAHRGLPVRLTGRDELDLDNEASIAGIIERANPWAIVNAAGFVRVADAEREVEACMAANATGAGRLARAAAAHNIPFVTFSSDLVFNGLLGRAYCESDATCPANVYGHSKAAAERLVAAAGGQALIVRTSAFFGPWDRYNFAWGVIEALRRGEPVSASETEIVSPTFVPDLCHAVLDLLIDGETGIWHLANQGALSWFDFARAIAEGAGLDTSLIFARETAPAQTNALVSERGNLLRPLPSAMQAYLEEVGAARDEPADPTLTPPPGSGFPHHPPQAPA
jgi:dTDP-4-dehydrorhamnose reductase